MNRPKNVRLLTALAVAAAGLAIAVSFALWRWSMLLNMVYF